MHQAESYSGGYGAPTGQNYASAPPPSYEFNPYGAPSQQQQQPQGVAYVHQPEYPAQQQDSASYSPSSAYFAPAAPSYVPSYGGTSPGAPAFVDYYGSSAPPSSTPPAHQYYEGGGYGGGLQSYGSAPAQGYYDSSDYGRVGYEQQQQQASNGGNAYDDGGYAEVYAYDGGNAGEPYGARGTGGSSWNSTSIAGSGGSGGAKVARAVPKADSDSTGGGIQKYRVKMLPDASSSTSKDVICQIGLDGVRMLDPSTSRTLRIYPLETITRWEVYEPAIFTFWAKSAVDVEQRCIRLQSSSYTTSQILDTITAACVQLCEMVGKDGKEKDKVGSSTSTETSVARKSSIADLVFRTKAATEEEKQHWVPDEAATKCSNCDADFSAFVRRHHCRNCGDVFCDWCTRGRTPLTGEEGAQAVRVCDRCLAEVTQRLTNAKEVSKVPPPRTHEDLAKKLQEELERNAGRKESGGGKGSSGSNSKGEGISVLNCNKCGNITLVSGGTSRCPSCGADSPTSHAQGSTSATTRSSPRTREVACPTCTVHLQVQVPSSGTETVECGVCQHPFLVSA
jgi:hypothetical protein